MRSVVIAVLLATFFAAPAVAANMYAGVNAGSARIDSTGTVSSSSWTVLGGYTIVDNIAAEVAYSNFGRQSGLGVTSKSNAISLSGIVALPMNEQLSLFAKLGFASTVWDVSGASVSKSDWTYGFGGIVKVNEQIDLRGSYDIYQVENSVLSDEQKVLSVGVAFNF